MEKDSAKPSALTAEEFEAETLLAASGHICGDCGEDLHFVDELFLIQVVYLNRVGETFEMYFVEDEDGEFEYDPYFFHLECWEKNHETLGELVDETPAIIHPASIAVCSCCKSDILPWEVTGSIQFGELHRSQKTPNHEATLYFHVYGSNPTFMCLSCLIELNDQVIELWEDGVDQHGECIDGSHERCWRRGLCQRECKLDCEEAAE